MGAGLCVLNAAPPSPFDGGAVEAVESRALGYGDIYRPSVCIDGDAQNYCALFVGCS